jgi:sugar lactone lactonase YvrE
MRTLFISTLLLVASAILLQSCTKKKNDSQPGAPGDTSRHAVSTLAGTGNYGFKDGAGTTARFNDPYAVATDVSGNVYVADAGNNSIRKITPAGLASTIAGDGTRGFKNGDGASAEFNFPHALVVDPAGNIYVADTFNQVIRKITPAGTVSTFAGDGTPGLADGTGTTAEFNAPSGIAIDRYGNLFVSDSNNQRIRQITPTGVVSTLNINILLSGPQGIAIDASGNLYVVESGKSLIRKITTEGAVITIAGTEPGGFADGQGATALFFTPEGIVLDPSGNLYIGDLGNDRIRKITPTGLVSTIAGGIKGNTNGAATDARFNAPAGLAIDAFGNLYVADVNNHSIRKIQL